MNTEKQQQAHDLYFHTGKTQQEIADILDVHRHTVRLWIKKNRWDEMKAAARQMPSLILQHIYTHINALNDKIFSRPGADRCPTMQEVGMLHKLLIMTRSIQKQHTGSYMEAFQELRLFVFNRDSALAKELAGHIDAYLRGSMGDREFMTRKRRKDNVLEATATLAKQELREQKEEDNEQLMEQECIDNVQFCNPATPPAHHAPQGNSGSVEGEHPSLAEVQECIDNVQFCTKNGASPASSGDSAKVFTVAANGDVTISNTPAECKVTDTSEKCHILSGDQVAFPLSAEHDTAGEQVLEKAMALPPDMRPSPLLVGDTVWILHPDHLESRFDTYGNPWGPMKMSYNIRYYPDIDPAKAA